MSTQVMNRERLIGNAMTLRDEWLRKIGILDPPLRDIDKECGYPPGDTIPLQNLKAMYDREGIANRVVGVYPESCWSVDPYVYETVQEEETEFEKRLGLIVEKNQLWHYLHRVDELSGIGRYGVLLLGIDDGSSSLSEPVDGIDPSTGEADEGEKEERNLLYLMPYDESFVSICEWEKDWRSPRYMKPTLYEINIADPTIWSGTGTGARVSNPPDQKTEKVHWTRIIHAADNCKSSDIFGVPRQQSVYNRLYDIRKIAGSSAEMFWKGGFPGYSFEVMPNTGDMMAVELDPEAMREEFEKFSNSLQRYMALVGVSAKSLAPQVADPSAHVNVQLMLIAITLGVPMRIFMGSEEGKLASTQDKGNWNGKVHYRMEKYLTPRLVRPTIDRLMAIGVLPTVEKYIVHWPDLNTQSNMEKAEVALKLTDSMGRYMSSGADQLMARKEYLTKIFEFTTEEADAIIESADEQAAEEEKKMLDMTDKMMKKGLLPEGGPTQMKPDPPKMLPGGKPKPSGAAGGGKPKRAPTRKKTMPNAGGRK